MNGFFKCNLPHGFLSPRACRAFLQICLLAGLVVPDLVRAEEKVSFSREIQVLLSDRCYQCHGPDEGSRKGGLRLDVREDALKAGDEGAAIVPGKPDQSLMLQRIMETDPDLRMPPPESGKSLSAQEVERLRLWIEQGAEYRNHWAFEPIRRPKVPNDSAIAELYGDASLSPIDAYVGRRLLKVGLTPSPLADRRTLIRRVHLDLLGLPPSLEALHAYLNDTQPGAYERMLDQALESPHFGEKWGRHWLDQARYADTHGYTIDSQRSIWPYRDWVIQAINEDLPFDQFTIEQLAGDLMQNPTRDNLVATGFHRNTLVNQEGGTDREQFRNEAVVDRVNTTGAVWLGLTVGCAQCHTHKYDPLTQHEYYQLFAFFNSGKDVNSAGPTLSLPGPEDEEKRTQLEASIREARQELKAYQAKGQSAEESESTSKEGTVDWTFLEPVDLRSGGETTFKGLGDGSSLASGATSSPETYTFRTGSPGGRWTALRLEVLTHPSLPKGGPGRAGNGNFVLSDIALESGALKASWLHAHADHSQPRYDVTAAIDTDPITGWAINGAKRVNVQRTAVFLMDPLEIPKGESVEIRLHFPERPEGYSIGRFRLAMTGAPLRQLGLPDPEGDRLTKRLKKLEDQLKNLNKGVPSTMVMEELDKPRETHVHIRGDFLRKGDQVTPDTPAFLPSLKADQTYPGRLDLARWLVRPDHPLTARVVVNRMWMRLFGKGLVETENDFGLQGTPPTHPELLDWLADHFIRNGWSRKQLLRTIMTSVTYRQSSQSRPELVKADPLNQLLGAQARIRVDAESVRDMALAASGLLVPKIGGPSVYPPQPDGVYAFTQRRASWPTSKGPDRYRRAMYTFFMRSAPHPLFTTFDAPAFNTTCTRRPRSNTPLQALTLANDSAFFEMNQALGKLLQSAEGAPSERIEQAFLRCLSRPPTSEESRMLEGYFETQHAAFKADPEAAAEVTGGASSAKADAAGQAAWVLVARILMNLDEFITRE